MPQEHQTIINLVGSFLCIDASVRIFNPILLNIVCHDLQNVPKFNNLLNNEVCYTRNKRG